MNNNKIKVIKGNVLSKKFLAIDIETTGLNPKSDIAGIIEVYAGIYSKGVLTDKFHQLYFHEHANDTYDLHRISDEDLAGKPKFTDCNNNELVRLLNECCSPDSNLTLMAYYAPFEYQWLTQFLGDRVNWPHLRVCDPRHLYKIVDPAVSHKLVDAARVLCDIVPEEGSWAFHRARDDARVMTQVYASLLEELSLDDMVEYEFEKYQYIVKDHLHDRTDVDDAFAE